MTEEKDANLMQPGRAYVPTGSKVEQHRQGGEGSGNFGHAGRPGEVGGSGEGGGFSKGDTVSRIGSDNKTLIVEKVIDVVDGKYITTGTGYTVHLDPKDLHISTPEEIKKASEEKERGKKWLEDAEAKGDKLMRALSRGQEEADYPAGRKIGKV
jgi:hypothetical protein